MCSRNSGMNSSPGSQLKNTRPLLMYSLGLAERYAQRSGATSSHRDRRNLLQPGEHLLGEEFKALFGLGMRHES